MSDQYLEQDPDEKYSFQKAKELCEMPWSGKTNCVYSIRTCTYRNPAFPQRHTDPLFSRLSRGIFERGSVQHEIEIDRSVLVA